MARALGLLTPSQVSALEARLGEEERVRAWFRDTTVPVDGLPAAEQPRPSRTVPDRMRASDAVKRQGVSARDVLRAAGSEQAVAVSEESLLAVEVDLKYEGYVRRERQRADRLRAQSGFRLSDDLPYAEFVTLSHEAREKLARIRPDTLAHAARISGVSPADLQNLVLEVRRRVPAARGSGA
jgi:tRNA uridine 5-carboxymethylaminomethyl modification enzyme